jgi:FAD/FMN-containing dehydrogenase/Fe-S oxidoreductase
MSSTTTTSAASIQPLARRTDNIDAARLVAELRHNVRGEVRFDDGSRALYARDASNYRMVPIGVVVPRNLEDVVATLDSCRRYGAPILARGGGTSLAGQCCNVAVVLDFSKYLHRVIEIDPELKLARVQPGVILDHLRSQAARHQLTFGPDPATHNHCTLGGMIGNNSCGIHSVMAGRTADNVRQLDILTYDGVRMSVGPTSDDELARIIHAGGRRGEIYRDLLALRDKYANLIRERYPNIPRRVSGYNLDELLPENGFNVARALVGSECTCALVLEATLDLVHSPSERVLAVLCYDDIYMAGDHIPTVMQHHPIGLEGLDHNLLRYNEIKNHNTKAIQLLPGSGGYLLVEFGGATKQEARDRAEQLRSDLAKQQNAPAIAIFDDDHEQAELWEVRESGLGATAFVPGEHDTWPGWEDAAVAPDQVGDYLRSFRHLLEKYGYQCSLYGHFGQGCVHTRIDFELHTAEGLEKYRNFAEEAADLVVSHGGSLSGEHGDGQSRAELLPKMFGEELIDAFRQFKSIWDPQWKMNPGKVVAPYRLDEHLTLGTHYNPPRPRTHFHFAEDHGDFAHATLRCVGVGKCRREEGGTMCPSYMVTREEKHSTRGRAHLLFEMLQGDVIRDGWQSEVVKDALDLCLACKGCKGECPVNVDMATYKAEFLSHYYRHHRRPRTAYSMGWISWWARLASLAPTVVNWASHAPGLQHVVKGIGGISRQRDMPRFAPETFRVWFDRRPQRIGMGPEVMLWPDTFNNHFHPEVAKAAVRVLEHAGFHVTMPQAVLCCGRPLYDYGMLDTAKRFLENILNELREPIRRGVCLVGLEPSCVTVFRDELTGLFPRDDDALRLSQQTYLLSEFLLERDYHPPRLDRQALVHLHCHHKSIMGSDSAQELLARMGLDADLIDSGCCGMAGSFGFEDEHYDISVACGERALLPAVRRASHNTLIIADGFSCQEQIRQLTDRRALHVAQVMAMALDEGPIGPQEYFPEQNYSYHHTAHANHLAVGAFAFAAGMLLATGLARWALSPRSEGVSVES